MDYKRHSTKTPTKTRKMNSVLMTYLGVGIFAIAGLIFAILIKVDKKR